MLNNLYILLIAEEAGELCFIGQHGELVIFSHVIINYEAFIEPYGAAHVFVSAETGLELNE